MRNSKRKPRSGTNQVQKQPNAHTNSSRGGMRVTVGEPWEVDVTEPSSRTEAITKARVILMGLRFGGIVFMAFSGYAMWVGDKAMMAQIWNTAQSIMTGVMVWAMGQKLASNT